MFQADCTSYSGLSYTTSQVLDLLDRSQLVISSSSESESEYDLSEPEAEVMSLNSEELADNDDSASSLSDTEVIMSALTKVPHDPSYSEPMDYSESRGRGARGRGGGGGKTSGRRQRQNDDFNVYDLTTVDNNVPSLYQFNLSRSIGVHLPSQSEDWSPEELFKLYFDSEIVSMICDASQ